MSKRIESGAQFVSRCLRELDESRERIHPAIESTRAPRITIKRDAYGEFRVPTDPCNLDAEKSAYYTDDRDDAKKTAQHIFGSCVVIRFKTVEEF